MKIKSLLVGLVLTVLSIQSVQAAEKEKDENCEKIKQACLDAGFVAKDWKNGDGLWAHCIDPIMQSKAQSKKATKALPTVDPTLISACRAANPHFGMHVKK